MKIEDQKPSDTDVPSTGNAKRDAFCDEYIIDFNATRAAQRAGYSPKSAHVQGHDLLKNPKVKARIDALKRARAARAQMSADEVLEELAKLARANMQDYMVVGPHGDPVLDWSKLTRDQAAALQEVTVDDYVDGRGDEARDVRRVKFKLADKKGALVELGKHLGLFPNKVELGGPNGSAIPFEVRRTIVEGGDD